MNAPELAALISAAAALGVGLLSGVVSGLMGVTPGGILVPLLGLLLGLDPLTAQGVSLTAQLVPTSLAGVRHYRSAGHRIGGATILALSAGFLGGALGGAYLALRLSATLLSALFIAYLTILAAALVLRRAPRHDSAAAAEPAPRQPQSLPAVMLLGAIGAIAGASSGLLGIGGGLALTVLLAGLVHYSQHQAQSASLLLSALPLGLPAVWLYAVHGPHLPWLALVWVVAGLFLGTAAGARIAVRLDARTLRRGFLVVLLLMIAAMSCRLVQGGERSRRSAIMEGSLSRGSAQASAAPR